MSITADLPFRYRSPQDTTSHPEATQTMPSHEEQVTTFLEERGITYTTRHVGQTRRDNWDCDQWDVTFARQGAPAVHFDYFTGLGHRKQGGRRPVSPPAAGVLSSILLDMSASEMSFSDWCADFGYDEDSRKALATYEACQQGGDKLRRLFGSRDVDTLRGMLQDY